MGTTTDQYLVSPPDGMSEIAIPMFYLFVPLLFIVLSVVISSTLFGLMHRPMRNEKDV